MELIYFQWQLENAGPERWLGAGCRFVYIWMHIISSLMHIFSGYLSDNWTGLVSGNFVLINVASYMALYN